MPNKLIRANDGTVIGSSFFIVGSVQQTFLGATEFESIMGSDWVLADGRDVTGSLYESVTGNSTVPDCRGLFLRTVGGNADPAIGGTQSDAARIDGVMGIDGTASNPASEWVIDMKRFGGTWTGVDVGGTLNNPNETRPVNITVNTYIKVN